MEFLVDHSIDDDTARVIEHEIWRVDPDAKVKIDGVTSLVRVES
ncbi:hypothetical protein [Burkholderia cenocepacia]|nr:hypothetical protein [Burkholderia cenocepacia]